eukprot:TRINITY_DN75901_c0_g1_i1.p1 TRINITY_DN75901_c0_g1~~TRINITY_DN75901_c0_g1_i1.p1  ORF type:complete len:125 (+),score=18.09 TRINITY_DN75901_c0_g1_i1:119-493(+)
MDLTAPGLNAADTILLSHKLMNAQNDVAQRVCWERCSDTMLKWDGLKSGVPADESLPQGARQCIDACTSKFAELAMRVSAESQICQERILREQQAGGIGFKLAMGAGIAAVAGLGCYLFRAGDD